MNKIMQDLKGAYNLVKEYEPLTKEIAEKIIAEGKHIAETVSHDIQMAEKYLTEEAAKLAGATQTATPAAATEGQPATETQTPPVDQTTAQPTGQEQANPATNSTLPADGSTPAQVTPAPAEQTTTPADPNAMPAADPNQAQTTTPQVQIQ